MRDRVDLEMLDRYMAGTATPDESAQVQSWMARDAKNAAMLPALRVPDAAPAVNVDAAWRKQAAKSFGHAVTHSTHRYEIFGTIFGAVLAVGAVIAFAVPRTPSPQPFREFSTTAGNRATVTLRDGTRLILGPDTHVRVPNDFGISTRTVNLDGEAYFTVVHNAQHPFTVHARRATITDVGTVFDIRNYASDHDVRVAVTQGEVALSAGTRPARPPTLSAGDMAVVNDSGVTITRHADVSVFAAWTQGGLVFKNTPLAQVVRDVARSFDLSVTIADSTLASQPVTATFAHESADEVLDEVTAIIGARFERVGQRVTIRRRTGRADQRVTPAPHTQAPLQTAIRQESHE